MRARNPLRRPHARSSRPRCARGAGSASRTCSRSATGFGDAFGTEAACVGRRMVLACRGWQNLPGTRTTPAALGACVEQLAALDCRTSTRTLVYPTGHCEIERGSLAAEMPCEDHLQCASGDCERAVGGIRLLRAQCAAGAHRRRRELRAERCGAASSTASAVHASATHSRVRRAARSCRRAPRTPSCAAMNPACASRLRPRKWAAAMTRCAASAPPVRSASASTATTSAAAAASRTRPTAKPAWSTRDL